MFYAIACIAKGPCKERNKQAKKPTHIKQFLPGCDGGKLRVYVVEEKGRT